MDLRVGMLVGGGVGWLVGGAALIGRMDHIMVS